MESQTLTDEQLLVNYYSCENEALSSHLKPQLSLEGRHKARMFNGARTRFRGWGFTNPDLVADEALQNTWIRVMNTKRRHSGRWKQEGGRVDRWLNTILYNECARLAEKEGKGPTGIGGENEEANFFPDPTKTPDHALAEDERVNKLRACLESLTKAQREVVDMKYWHGMKQKDIAESLNMGQGGVANRLKAARDRLSLCMDNK